MEGMKKLAVFPVVQGVPKENFDLVGSLRERNEAEGAHISR